MADDLTMGKADGQPSDREARRAPIGISVVIPTFRRPDQLLNALARIMDTEPPPAEIIVHIDAGDDVTLPALRQAGLDRHLVVLQSKTQQGPGGGRNVAIQAARHELVASFDDDSFPLDQDFFWWAERLLAGFVGVAVVEAAIFHLDEEMESPKPTAKWVASFAGCGCVYRKSAFQATDGYVPLPFAYGMEEVDLSLKLQDLGWGILQVQWLRVLHNTRLEHHGSPQITAASIANQCLLSYLRYPAALLWLGPFQALSRVMWLMRHGRWRGIAKGLIEAPALIWRFRNDRKPIAVRTLLQSLRVRRSHEKGFEILVEGPQAE